MFSEEDKYAVSIEEYAEKKYIKKFRKLHKNNWDITQESIVQMLERAPRTILTDKLVEIRCTGECGFYKCYFRIHKTKNSSKSSGCRAIVYFRKKDLKAFVLLAYSKNFAKYSEGHETNWIIGEVRKNFPEYWKQYEIALESDI
ncbi:hypothetical protein KKH43_05940 [Patescibacteria group bacterium]|nr:hypothetical protein [Patescibacteria group bacterium]